MQIVLIGYFPKPPLIQHQKKELAREDKNESEAELNPINL